MNYTQGILWDMFPAAVRFRGLPSLSQTGSFPCTPLSPLENEHSSPSIRIQLAGRSSLDVGLALPCHPNV